ncbi:MAG: hypothetical protein VYB44_06840 [Bacteroidota bacterium]|nr:hypothetical protein [Bacteroidota bacterium]
MMKIKLFILLLIAFNSFMIKGQTLYRTTEGHIVMVAEVDDEQVIVESHQLLIQLDYDTKEISGKLNLKSLDVGNGFLSEQISQLAKDASRITFYGRIPVDDFISQPHSPISFNWPIKIITDEREFQVVMNATLKHFNGGESIACLLSATGDFSTKEVGLASFIPGVSEVLKVQFTQVILRKNTL